MWAVSCQEKLILTYEDRSYSQKDALVWTESLQGESGDDPN